jgi:hypothetical protein
MNDNDVTPQRPQPVYRDGVVYLPPNTSIPDDLGPGHAKQACPICTLGRDAASHADEARHFADETEVHNDALSILYGEERRDSVRIAQVHQNLRTSQKLAEVHARPPRDRRRDAPPPTGAHRMSAESRESIRAAIRAAISNAYHADRRTWRTMEQAADDAADAVMVLVASIDRNARAYGWEVGMGSERSERIETTPGNPFVEDGAR